MTKKIFLSVLIGIIVISVTACGNKQSENQAVETNSEDPYTSVYSESLFFGDSILEGLSEVLKDSNVISNAGATAQFSLEKVDNIAKKKPKNVFIMLGSDDILMPVDNPKKQSMTHYAKFIEKLREKLPDSKMHVLSVTPVTKEAIEKEPKYKNIPDYNKALKKMAATEEVDYIDLSSIFKEHRDLYTEDGIHLKASFYPLLLDYIEKHNQDSNINMEMHNEA